MIDKNKAYSLYQIHKYGLLIRNDGQPYTSPESIRKILIGAGFKPVGRSIYGENVFAVSGKELIKLNNSIKAGTYDKNQER